MCGKTGDEEDLGLLDDPDEDRVLYDASEEEAGNHPFYWSEQLQQSFREELEK